MRKNRTEIYDDSDYEDTGSFSEKRKKKTGEFDDMKGAAFRDFLKSVGLTAKDEKAAMTHLNSFLKYSKDVGEDDEEEGEEEETRWYNDDRPEGYDKKQLGQKSKVLRYTNSAYDDDDDDYLKDRLQQNEQYYTKR